MNYCLVAEDTCIWKIAEMARTRVFCCLEQWRSAKGQSWVEGGKKSVKGGNFCDERQAEMNKKRKRRILQAFSVLGGRLIYLQR